MDHPLYLTHRDPACNMARFYELAVEPSLFGGWLLLRRWGRIGTRGRSRLMSYDSRDEAEQGLAHLADRKRRRGYRDQSPRRSVAGFSPISTSA